MENNNRQGCRWVIELIEFIEAMKVKQTLLNGCDIDTVHLPSLLHKIKELSDPIEPCATSSEKTDFQIAWELSQTKDKPFFVDTIKKLLNAYDGEEISFSRFVEELNVAAYKWRSKYTEELLEENYILFKDNESKSNQINKLDSGECGYEASFVSCDLCGHTWAAVRPEGLERLQCPKCKNIANFENITNNDTI